MKVQRRSVSGNLYKSYFHNLRGGGFPVFKGQRTQTGGLMFGSLFKSAAPIIRQAAKVGKEVLPVAAEIVRGVSKGGPGNLGQRVMRESKKALMKKGKEMIKQELVNALTGKKRKAPVHRRRRPVANRRGARGRGRRGK